MPQGVAYVFLSFKRKAPKARYPDQILPLCGTAPMIITLTHMFISNLVAI